MERGKGRKVELLSPAGSFEALSAALANGADAIYLAGDRFGARAYAKNFDREELLRAMDLAHLLGKRLYLTVNTLLKNREMEELPEYLAPLVEAGLDACLVQDMGVLRLLRRTFPKLDLHASTQMTVTGTEGLRFLQELGVTRVVPARELSLGEISQMCRATDLEIEVFIHGAMCYSYSGQCLFSSIAGGRSGNRGRCAQPCRLSYQAGGRGNICPLSMKDMMALSLLPELYEAGVASLKIEGRMKQPSYVAGVTRIYRRYMDLLEEDGPEGFRVDPKDREELLGLYSRGGSCEGYYHKDHGKDMIFFSGGGKKGEGSEEPFLSEPKLSISGHCVLLEGEESLLTVWADQEGGPVSFTARGSIPGRAVNKPIGEEDVKKRLSRVGESEFSWKSLRVDMAGDLFLPLGEINNLRRSALEGLKEAILTPYRREASTYPSGASTSSDNSAALKDVYIKEGLSGEKPEERVKLMVSAWEPSVLEVVLGQREVDGIYLPPWLYREGKEKVLSSGKEVYLYLPSILRRVPGELPDFLRKESSEGLTGFVTGSLEGYALLCRLGLSSRTVTDHSLYTWNQEALAFFKEHGALRITAPLELNAGELSHRGGELCRDTDLEMPVYGYLPLMVSAQCVRCNTTGCDKSFSRATITDGEGRSFVSKCLCKPLGDLFGKGNVPCMNIIYNNLPYSLLGDGVAVNHLSPRAVRADFTIESPREAEKILRRFAAVFGRGEKISVPSGENFTRGHFRRGAK